MAIELRVVTLVPGQQSPSGCHGIGYNGGIVWEGEEGTCPSQYASVPMTLTEYKGIIQLPQINADVNEYINNYYDVGTQQTFTAIYTKRSTPDTARNYLDPVWDWIETVMTYYYGKKTDITNATTLTALRAITWDFETFDATKPNVSLQALMDSLSD